MTPITQAIPDAQGASAEAEQALAVPVEPASSLAPSGFDPSRVAKALSPIQRTILTRQMIRIGNPTVLVPCNHPKVPQRTWHAVLRKNLIAFGRFGYALTPEGAAVRDVLCDSDEHRDGEDAQRLSGEAMPARVRKDIAR